MKQPVLESGLAVNVISDLRVRNLRERERGNALVEFALVIPFLILIIMGIFDLGWAVYANNTLALAAREGARQAIITGNGDEVVRTQVVRAAVGLNLTDAQIVIAPSGSRSPNQPVTISVSYTYSPVTPLIARIIGGSGRLTLRSQATMIVEP